MRLGEIGEGDLIQRIRNRFQSPDVIVGIGDDAAILDVPAGHSLVFCSDLVAEDSHFLRHLHPPDSVGYKAVAVNVSDVGAMGGIPTHFLVSLAAPADLDLAWVDGFYDGIQRACGDFGVSLVGGDTSSANLIFIDVAMIGRVPAGSAIRRSGAQIGDGIYVTGTLGSSVLGLELLRSGTRVGAAVQRHLYPQPRHHVGAAVAGKAHAMIDVSDGLSTDLNHIVVESKVSARIYADKLPRAPEASDSQVLNGGEEYELIIAAADLPDSIGGVPLTRIGEIIAAERNPQVFLDDALLPAQGWQHF